MAETQPPTTPELGSIKGAAFREFLVFYARSVSLPRVRSAVLRTNRSQLAPDRGDFGVQENVWYAAELVHGILDHLSEGLTEAELEKLAQDAATHVTHVSLRGIQKTLFSWLATPDRCARHIGKLWRVHYDNGEPAIVTRAAGEHHITFMSWHSHHPLACRINMAAAQPIYGAMGCKDVKWRRTHCKSLGGAHCTCIVTWRVR